MTSRRLLPVIAAPLLLTALPLHAQHTSPSLTGTWAQLVSTTATSRLPVLGEVSTRTRVYSIVNVEQTANALELKTKACWVRLDGDVKKIRAIVPDEMVRVIGPRARPGTLARRGEELHMRLPAMVDVVGAELANPARDPLPTAPDDDTVIDEDRDGYPGVTIRMVGIVDGELRVVQRTTNEFLGKVAPDGASVAGTVRWRSEQNVLDATSSLLEANVESTPHPDPARSFFRMQRIDRDASCEDVLRDHARLFPE